MNDAREQTYSKALSRTDSAQSSGDYLVTNMKLMTQTQFALQEATRLILDELAGLRSDVKSLREEVVNVKKSVEDNSLI